jgi:hypothetical protein
VRGGLVEERHGLAGVERWSRGSQTYNNGRGLCCKAMRMAAPVRELDRGSAPPTLKSDLMVQRSAQLRRRVGSACAQANAAAGTSHLYSAAATEAAIGCVELAKLDVTWAALEAYMVEPLPEDLSALADGRCTPVLLRQRPSGAGAPPGVATLSSETADGLRRASTAAAVFPGRTITSGGLCGQATHLDVLISPRAQHCGGSASASARVEGAGGRNLPGRPSAAQRGLDDLSARRRKKPDGNALLLRHTRAAGALDYSVEGGGGSGAEPDCTMVRRVLGGAVTGGVMADTVALEGPRPHTAHHVGRPPLVAAPPRPMSQPNGSRRLSGGSGAGVQGCRGSTVSDFNPHASPSDVPSMSPGEKRPNVVWNWGAERREGSPRRAEDGWVVAEVGDEMSWGGQASPESPVGMDGRLQRSIIGEMMSLLNARPISRPAAPAAASLDRTVHANPAPRAPTAPAPAPTAPTTARRASTAPATARTAPPASNPPPPFVLDRRTAADPGARPLSPPATRGGVAVSGASSTRRGRPAAVLTYSPPAAPRPCTAPLPAQASLRTSSALPHRPQVTEREDAKYERLLDVVKRRSASRQKGLEVAREGEGEAWGIGAGEGAEAGGFGDGGGGGMRRGEHLDQQPVTTAAAAAAPQHASVAAGPLAASPASTHRPSRAVALAERLGRRLEHLATPRTDPAEDVVCDASRYLPPPPPGSPPPEYIGD